MSTPKQMGFHEATVVRFCRYDAVLEIELEDVLVDGQKSRVTLMVSPVSSVLIDGELSNVNVPLMEANDGEILTVDMSENALSLIIEWNDFSRGKAFTKSYRVSGGKVSVSVI